MKEELYNMENYPGLHGVLIDCMNIFLDYSNGELAQELVKLGSLVMLL